MSYLNRRYGTRRGIGALGGLEDVLTSAGAVASDPYLPEVVCQMAQLKQIEAGGVAGECLPTADGLTGGIGLRNAVVPLRMYVYAQGHKWVYPLAVLALFGLPMWVGYELGRKGG
jgi:hypothetical protein